MTHEELFCNDCMTRLTLHADGTLACSCSTQEEGEMVPARWVVAATDQAVTRAELGEIREAEMRYSAGE